MKHHNGIHPEDLVNVQEIEDTESLAHLSASHSNALVENPFD